jgi:CRISPR/Cas system-associated endoribonuclease Cas2
MEKRILKGRTAKLSTEERDKIRAEKLKERFEFEKDRMGGYELIFPSKNEE